MREHAGTITHWARTRLVSLGLLGVAALLSIQLAESQPTSGSAAAGQSVFATRCATCHGTNAGGGEFAPSIIERVPLRSDDELMTLLHDGLSAGGMPAFPDIAGSDRANLIAFLRTLRPPEGTSAHAVSVTVQGEGTIQGIQLNQSSSDLQLLADDHTVHLLRRRGDGQLREVSSQTDWTGYNGTDGSTPHGGRYSPLDQINRANVARLQSQWLFPVPATRVLQGTPIVAQGLMYVTAANECYALDAGSGRMVWHYQRSRTKGISGVSATGVNRGAAYASGRIFMDTDNAHVIALDARTGTLLWDTAMTDWHDNYNATSAPLVVGDLIVTGAAGGDDGARGFILALDQKTGRELWRFWSVPRAGEPGSESWQGPGIEHPGGAMWMTGVYDRELDSIYWDIGNPGNDMIGDDRPGDNLYTDSVVALDPHTGRMKWYFQFTPHDVHDYDATEPLALIDAPWQGQPRKLLAQANRNGFFYVLDRVDGKYLLGTAFTPKLTWASGLDSAGRPEIKPHEEPRSEGTLVCPWLNGASNWYSSSYNPITGLYYVQTNDRCGLFTRADAPFERGRSYMGGSFGPDPADPAEQEHILRAFDIHTGKAVWQIPQIGPGDSWGGVLSTAGLVVFYGADDGAFTAADARSGKVLWRFQSNQGLHASPMTYEFDHHQYVAIASGPNIIAFSLPQ
jgi:alcohol dehydrogenase (cytochrome c)